MSNAERLIEALAEAFSAAERSADESVIDNMVAAVHPFATDDFSGVMSGGENFEATYDGLEGLREAWADWAATFEQMRFEIEDVEEVGENVVTMVCQVGVTRHGGVEIRQPSAAVWMFRGDGLYRIEFHLDRDEALRRAGLP